jgi:hypothetical protein
MEHLLVLFSRACNYKTMTKEAGYAEHILIPYQAGMIESQYFPKVHLVSKFIILA